MTWQPTWWQWLLLYGIGLPLVLLAAPYAAMAAEAATERLFGGRRLRRERQRVEAITARYQAGECRCPVHGWMLKADADEHTRLFHPEFISGG